MLLLLEVGVIDALSMVELLMILGLQVRLAPFELTLIARLCVAVVLTRRVLGAISMLG